MKIYNRKFLQSILLVSVFLYKPDYAQSCTDCHAGLAKEKVIHGALEAGCESCHNKPHADKNKPVLSLQAQMPELCYNCHENKSGDGSHPALEVVNCTSCHNPHSSSFKSLLRTNISAACSACHNDELSGRHITRGKMDIGHPVEGAVNPLKKTEEFSCVSCHDPHKSVNSKLLRMSGLASKDRCNVCHTKIKASSGQ